MSQMQIAASGNPKSSIRGGPDDSTLHPN